MMIDVSTVTLAVSPSEEMSSERIAEWNKRKSEHEYQARMEAQRTKLEPVFREPRAAEVLQLLKQNSHTGESLYKMYELAEGHPSFRQEFQA